MMEYLLLANPGHNRVYLDAAQGAEQHTTSDEFFN